VQPRSWQTLPRCCQHLKSEHATNSTCSLSWQLQGPQQPVLACSANTHDLLNRRGAVVQLSVHTSVHAFPGSQQALLRGPETRRKSLSFSAFTAAVIIALADHITSPRASQDTNCQHPSNERCPGAAAGASGNHLTVIPTTTTSLLQPQQMLYKLHTVSHLRTPSPHTRAPAP
jgi:hypothetical protein